MGRNGCKKKYHQGRVNSSLFHCFICIKNSFQTPTRPIKSRFLTLETVNDPILRDYFQFTGIIRDVDTESDIGPLWRENVPNGNTNFFIYHVMK